VCQAQSLDQKSKYVATTEFSLAACPPSPPLASHHTKDSFILIIDRYGRLAALLIRPMSAYVEEEI
jgi:hypothetical protein